LLERYQDISLPVDPHKKYPLRDIYQPLKLHLDPLMPDTLQREKRRAYLDELSDNEERDLVRREKRERREEEERQRVPVSADNGMDALEKSPHRHMVVLGGPGSGKTTILYRLLTDACHQAKERRPYYIACLLMLVIRPRKITRLLCRFSFLCPIWHAKGWCMICPHISVH
jgi:hypothetical protein